MTLTIEKNGPRDFTHVTEYANMTFSNYSMVLNNTTQDVIIMRPNGSSFPNSAVPIASVFFKDNTDGGVVEPFASTELLKARLIEVDYNGLVEPSGGGSGAVSSVFTRTGAVTAQSGDYNTGQVTEVTNKKYVTDAQLVVIGNTSGTNSGDNATNTQYSGLATSKQDSLTEDNFGTFTNSLTTENAIDDADVWNYRDTSDSGKQKKTLWSNIKTVLKAFFDSFYSTKTRIFLTSDITNGTVADTDVTGFTFTLPASGKVDFTVCLPFSAGANTTGINVGVKVVTGVGANGNVLGNVRTKTRLSTTTTFPVLNIVDQGANATVSYGAMSGVSTAGVTNFSEVSCDLTNLATNTSVTVQIVFASEVASSDVIVKKGASMIINS